MKPMTQFVMAAFAATALIPATAFAQSPDTKYQGYLVDSQGNAVVTSANTGLCWRDSDWTVARSVEPCDPVNRPVAAYVPPPAPRAAPVPPPMVAAPAPAPVPRAAVAVAPLPQRFSFSGDALFAFDKSVLKPEGKTMLDDLVRKLDGATYETIVATGHTDRFGSNAYNQKLSERRAHTVKDYLISKNVKANRIDAEGKGETQPITKAGECLGPKSPKVVACLQPDRRVDVETRGTMAIGSLR